jgi:hypothetical protein
LSFASVSFLCVRKVASVDSSSVISDSRASLLGVMIKFDSLEIACAVKKIIKYVARVRKLLHGYEATIKYIPAAEHGPLILKPVQLIIRRKITSKNIIASRNSLVLFTFVAAL